MTKQSTVLLSVSPRTIGPWGDDAWRISMTAQLVEGGSSSYWLATPTKPAQYLASPAAVTIELPILDEMLNTTLIMLALHVGNSEVEQYLLETGNISLDENVRTLAPYWDLSDEGRATLTRLLTPEIRLGVTFLEDPEALTTDLVCELIALGFRTDVFTSLSPVLLEGIER